jgi:hypothetical protein
MLQLEEPVGLGEGFLVPLERHWREMLGNRGHFIHFRAVAGGANCAMIPP